MIMCNALLQDSVPLSTLVMGDPSNTAPISLAQRLGKDVRDVRG